jgi:hypothetical protein
MSGSRALLEALLLIALAAMGLIIVKRVREQRALAELTVEEIEAQLDSLDPVTRAAVIARLTADDALTV